MWWKRAGTDGNFASRHDHPLAGHIMALLVTQGVPTLFFRRESYERAGLTRAALDARLGLTDAEFRVDGNLVAIGPIYDVDALGTLVDELEQTGLVYYEDYFELSGSWPEWLAVLVRAATSESVTAAS
jgi:hypothetical protein